MEVTFSLDSTGPASKSRPAEASAVAPPKTTMLFQTWSEAMGGIGDEFSSCPRKRSSGLFPSKIEA